MSNPLDDAPSIQHAPTRHAAEWGFGSMFGAGILAVMAMLTLQICVQLFFGPALWARQDLLGIVYVSIGGVVGVLGLNITCIVSAIYSMVSAFRHNQPCALGLGGLIGRVLVLLLWIFVFVDLFSVLDFLLRRQGHGGLF